ncbi:Papain-like cysteine protease AvrRpt2 [Rhodovulum sp. ES.010]|uniref:papain-like cysteine protease family protein n=1 Tax=Rhodovulum sp. ES.010 TaxID=1882821 RepID=UPI0009283563|nr:papain-like cysteine protease family protein [Rhodovulum sp. ES.010]SIO43845.1 Papain-like cysteine protease AvrRpt2 [Rhodovulum sp. ES.010]
MNFSEYVLSTSRPYAAILRDFVWFSSKQLNFDMQLQTQSNWCWAATATSVSHFYWRFSSWTQCKVAGAELDRTDCCDLAVPAPCNVPWYLDRALSRTDNFVSYMSGQASFATIKAEIDAGKPVGARIGWNGGGGHFMVIYGYGKVGTTEYLDIDDPIYGKSHLTVADFASNYQGSGTWTHTYFTKSYFKLPIRILYPTELALQRIWDLRPVLAAKMDPAFTGDLPAEAHGAELGGAQRVYALGLDALVGKKGSRKAPEAVALRVFELSNDSPQAFFDLSEDDEPRVLQMSASAAYLDSYRRALARALAVVDEKKEAEIRTLRVPALNFEALWLSYGSEKADQIVPMREAAGLAVDEPVSYAKAMEALREAAKPLADMDEEMGA